MVSTKPQAEKTSLNDHLGTAADVDAHDRPIAQGIRLRAATCSFGIKIKGHPNGAVVTPVGSTRVRRMRGDEGGA